eukprot:Protomagalhaensia_wolfi_Nauph_80__2938@NODE_3014_length_917_cov_483_785877_g2360_i0_p1_GENE_NODE_3014_length_917_cov_483_785877_g2360_i0NODE_3014_length_917_cov_483_785877_g2360_i0_p1_ORF_typecomplete_len204_score37_85DeoC/PF01791_9/5_7e27Interferon/PF00143_19/0_21_NODE_3014_length_917_cov_483_785877_g2360_i0198809
MYSLSFLKDVQEVRKANAGSSILIGTPVNFPRGNRIAGHDDIEKTKIEIEKAIELNVDEIDFLFPYKLYMEDTESSKQKVQLFVQEIINHIPKHINTKVILESGVLCDERLLRSACQMCIDAGVGFLKTATGKAGVGARPSEVRILVDEIKKSGKPIGLKVSGGVKTKEEAIEYIEIARCGGINVQGPKQMRIGTSKLHKAFL